MKRAVKRLQSKKTRQHRRGSKSASSVVLSAIKREAGHSSAKGIQALGIGFHVLDCLATARRPMTLREIAVATSMAPSKLRFYLVSFLQLSLVTQDPQSGNYSLGPYAIKLGLAALEQFDVITASKRLLYELVDTFGYSAFLAVWGTHGPTVVFRVDGPSKTVLEIRVGTVLPVLKSALGRVFMTYLPRSVTDPILKAELDASSSGLSRKMLEEIISATRKSGVSVAHGVLLTGFTAIAAPIMDHAGMPVAAISVIGPIGALDDDKDGMPARILLARTSELSKNIGWSDADNQRSQLTKA